MLFHIIKVLQYSRPVKPGADGALSTIHTRLDRSGSGPYHERLKPPPKEH